MSGCPNDCNAPIDFPKPIINRPSLRHIDYRIGTYSDFREALLRKLDQDPVLAPWSYRGPDDPGIALIEAASVLGDILTFYQDLYANELYLPTATLPQSIAGLVRLVGYRLSPGVGGQGIFAFEVSGNKPVKIPPGFPVTADISGLPDTATFETVSEIVALPALSKFPLYAPFTVPSVASGTSKFAIDTAQLTAAGVTLEKNNRLMLIDPSGGPAPYHQVAVVDKIEPRFEQTEITVKGAWLGNATPTVTAYKLGRDFRHFGYNAPAIETVVDSDGKAQGKDVSFTRRVGGSVLSKEVKFTPDYVYGPNVFGKNAASDYFALDSVADNISTGTVFLISLDAIPASGGPGHSVFVARQAISVQKVSLSLGSLSGASTLIQLNELVASGLSESTDIRSVQIHETTAGPLTLKGPRNTINGPTSQLYFFGNGQDYKALDGRSLQFQRYRPAPGQPDAVEQVTAGITASAVGDLTRTTLRPVKLQPALQKFSISEFPFTFPKNAPPVWVFGNLAVATQGKTEKPVVLGNGDSRASFLTFSIPKTPLTYLVSKSATPPEVPQLVVTVDNLEWKQIPSLFSAGPKDQVYIVREDTGGQSFVQFGDGETGARVPSGVGNVAVTYRTGTGAHGALKPGASADVGGKITGLDTVSLLDESTGGAPSEDPAKARQSAPGKIQSLGRLVSLRDFETETLGIPGVSVASAAWEIVDNVPAVAVTVLMDTGRAAELSTVTQLLHNYNVCRGPQRFSIIVLPGHRSYVYLDISIALAPSYLEENVFPDVRSTLASFFSPARGFGAREYRSRIEGVVQNVEGVLWNNVAALGSLGQADDPSALVLHAPPRSLSEAVPCASNSILALFPAHLSLSAMAAPVKVC
jgi:hypothetical protein